MLRTQERASATPRLHRFRGSASPATSARVLLSGDPVECADGEDCRREGGGMTRLFGRSLRCSLLAGKIDAAFANWLASKQGRRL